MSAFKKIACPHCQKSLKVSDDLAGKTRSCPYCHGSVKIPEAAPATAGSFDFSSLSADAGAAPVRREPGRSEKSPGWLQSSSESASSDVSLFLSCAIGTGLTVVAFAILYPLRKFYIAQLFWDRGPIQFIEAYLFFWSVAILILKWLHLKRQKDVMLLDVLPTEISEEITVKSLDKFVANIQSLPGSSSQSFLINRVLRGIEHFRVRKSAAETVTMMESQSALDANNVAGSFTIIKVFIWSLPILGFIGTVLGLSIAVSSLAASLASASDVSAMKGAMNAVFSGLATAFDTTLLALVLSMILKIPTSALQKGEEDLISSVDEYCNENFLRRLNDDGGASEPGMAGNAAMFREAVEAAMGTHHAELEKWLNRLDSVGGKLTNQLAEGLEKTAVRLQKQQQQQAAVLQQQQAEQQQQFQQQLREMAQTAGGIQTAMSALASEAGQMQSQVNGSFTAAQETLQQRFSGLEQGLNSLSTVLVKLGEQGVVVQQVPAPAPVYRRKRGWFS
jgi:hypothetical protein